MSSGRIILLGGPFPSTAMVFHHLKKAFPETRVIMEQRPSRVQTFLRRRKKFGVSQAAGQLLFRAAAVPMLEMAAHKRIEEIKSEYQLDESPIPPESCTQVRSVNDAETIELLRQAAPAAIVVNGTRLIAPEVLAAVKVPFVNLHSGITPMYRGVHGAYWTLAHNDQEHCGVTVHLLDNGIDTGPVLAQAKITPTARDNFASYPFLQLAAALPLLDSVLPLLLAGRTTTNGAAKAESRLWSHPTLAQYMRQRMRGVK